MSKSKLTPLEVVERYHRIYLEYEKAFNKDPFNQQELNEQLKSAVENETDIDSDDFLNKIIDIVIEKPQKRMDVNNAALRFVLFADFYMLTQEEDLPKEILIDYKNLPVKEELKPFYSIENEEFKKNEKQEVTQELKEYIKAIVNQIKSQKT